MSPERRVEQTLCRMCEERCGIDVCLENGRIVDIVGNKDHRWNHGRVCVKARTAMDMIYHPDRVLTPLKRTADGWQEIPLDQALDEIAARLAEIRERHGARSVGAWSGEAIGFAQQEKLARRFLQAFGSPNFLSPDALCWASRYMKPQARRWCLASPGLRERPLHRPVGCEPAPLAPQLQDIMRARRRGASLVVVDPRLSAIARRADIHAAVRPGTDGALAWGLIHLLVGSGGYDKEFVQRHVLGFSKVAEHLRVPSPPRWCRQRPVCPPQPSAPWPARCRPPCPTWRRGWVSRPRASRQWVQQSACCRDAGRSARQSGPTREETFSRPPCRFGISHSTRRSRSRSSVPSVLTAFPCRMSSATTATR